MSNLIEEKVELAQSILSQCIGCRGVWADSSRYRFQNWTRDFVLASMPVLLDSGEIKIVRIHLEELSKRQRPNGQIPILYLDRVIPFLLDKIKKSWRDNKLSFMLSRFLTGNLWNLTPGTRDSEILYIIGMHEYANRTGDQSLLKRYASNIVKALAYIKAHIVIDGLAIGCDWRDTMHVELGDKPLLTNNSLLFHAYNLVGDVESANALRLKINETFWSGNSLLDYPGVTRFDPLGASLAVLYDVVSEERYIDLVNGFLSVNSRKGFTIKCRHNPTSVEERVVIDKTDGIVVWPFVVGFSILALVKMNQPAMANDQFEKLLSLDGFREWYHPYSGSGYGAEFQLWSAMLFLRSARVLDRLI